MKENNNDLNNPLRTEDGEDDNNENMAIIEKKSESEDIILDNGLRQTLFYLFCIEYCISSCDGGIVPQQNEHMQKDFNAEGEESEVGLFGSIDYIGRILGALVMSFLINKIHRRFFFGGCCICKSITLIIALFTPHYYPNLIARFFSGIPQTLLTSYGTIWVDQFGKRKSRSMMLPIFQFSALLGIIVGYGLGIMSDAILPKNSTYGWRLSFGIEGIILGILGFVFIFYPKLYFSSTFYLNEGDDFKGKEKTSLEQTEERNKNRTENNLWRQLPKILCAKIFISTSIGNTVAFFGMRVIQFYADKFMELVLDVQKSMKFIYYIVLCLTGPVFGIIICGLICTKIGGYTSKKGMIFIFSLNVIACVSSSFITISLHQYIALPAAWLFLFCFAAATPLQGGIIIASLPKELKGNGYSINMFFLNALGSFPSSYVYALICDAINRDYPEQGNMRYRTTLMITMFYNYAGLILIGIASIFRFRIKGELGSEKEKEKEKEEDKDEAKNRN